MMSSIQWVVIGMLAFNLLIGFACLIKIYGLKETIDKIHNCIDCYIPARLSRIDSETCKIADLIENGEYDVDLELEEECECCDLCAEVSDDELDIHLISRERYAFDDRNDYLKYELVYYPNSDRLEYQTVKYNKETDEFEDDTFIIEHVAEVVGDGLRFFGVCSGDANVAYVRNNKFKSDFKIVRMVN